MHSFQGSDPNYNENGHLELLQTTYSEVQSRVPIGLVTELIPRVGGESGKPVGMPPDPCFLTCILRGVL